MYEDYKDSEGYKEWSEGYEQWLEGYDEWCNEVNTELHQEMEDSFAALDMYEEK